ncbi:hypothetical protein ACWD3I_43510 [Streptomyces sp. NPDC002817]|uniref:hypothetical protein n=1 Tax=Streptomyces sp. NPDC088357 TaxID=3154655 RepID=UPI0034164D16
MASTRRQPASPHLEPVSALDVSLQAQVAHVLMKPHADLGLTATWSGSSPTGWP